MEYFYAFLDENNVVTEVITGNDENVLIEGLPPEIWYGNFRGQVCKITYYDSSLRGTYAGIGYEYNAAEDIFIPPKPFPSWARSGSFWNAPIPMPIEDGKFYQWVEADLNWQEILFND